MKINRNNYEIFFVDYLDGRLSPDQTVELMSFLNENPDLKAELKEFDEIKIKPDNVKYSSKGYLKKSFVIDESNFDIFCIASLEGDLTTEEDLLFQKWLRDNPLKIKEFELYKKSRLNPERITFDQKSKLKKGVSVRRVSSKTWGYLSAAASVIILFSLYFLLINKGSDKSPAISENTEKIPFTINSPAFDDNKDEKDHGTENLQNSSPKTINRGEDIHKIASITETPAVLSEASQKKDDYRPNFITDSFPENLNKLSRRKTEIFKASTPNIALANVSYFEIPVSKSNLSLTQKAVKIFKKGILNEEEEEINPDKFTIWDIADAGISGINKIIGWEMELDKEYNEKGDLKALTFNSNTISFNHTTNK